MPADLLPALCYAGVGLALLLAGHAIFRGFTGGFALLGGVALGLEIGDRIGHAWLLAVILGIAFAFAAAFLVRTAAFVCGALVGAVVGIRIAVDWAGFLDPALRPWAGALAGGLLVGIWAAISVRPAVILFSSAVGALFALAGIGMLLPPILPAGTSPSLRGFIALFLVVALSAAGAAFQFRREGRRS